MEMDVSKPIVVAVVAFGVSTVALVTASQLQSMIRKRTT
jgi:hypothetical protein